MKRILLALTVAAAALGASAQGFPYNGTISNPDGSPVASRTVAVTFTVQKPDGTPVYSETHPEVTSDSFGRVSFNVGEGNVTRGAFKLVDWTIDGLLAEITIDLGNGLSTITTEALATSPLALGATSAGTILSPASANSRSVLTVTDKGELAVAPYDPSIIPDGYSRCIFREEFDYEGLPDPRYWGYEVGYVRGGEMQYYTEARLENAFVKDGCLNLRVLNDNWVDEKGETHPVTSASVTTQDKVKFTYGRIDVRAKVPSVLGSWPAIWLMPNDSRFGGWPNSGEIDIMESVGHVKNIVYFTAHCAGQTTDHKQYHYSSLVPNCHEDFHVYSLVWTERRLDFLVDNKRKFTVSNNSTTWRDWPYMFDFYVILNYAYGGSWGGQQGVDLTALPSTFQIDYVRIFQ